MVLELNDGAVGRPHGTTGGHWQGDDKGRVRGLIRQVVRICVCGIRRGSIADSLEFGASSARRGHIHLVTVLLVHGLGG